MKHQLQYFVVHIPPAKWQRMLREHGAFGILEQSIRTWVAENLSGRGAGSGRIWCFEDDDDAMVFKMRWCA